MNPLSKLKFNGRPVVAIDNYTVITVDNVRYYIG